MSRRKSDRATPRELSATLAERDAGEPGLAALALLTLGEESASPRRLERASELYEDALRALWQAEGEGSLRAMPLLASWLECAHARRAHLSGAERTMLDRSIGVMRRKAEALLGEAEPKILGGAPDGRRLFSGAYTLLQRMGQDVRALALLDAAAPNWAPT